MDRPTRIDHRTLAHHIAADVDRVAPLLARLLVIRAIWHVRHRYGDHSLWVAQDMAADCREELKAAGASTRELARALVPDHDVEGDLTAAIAGADRLNGAIRSESNAYARYSLATDPDIYIDQRRAGQLNQEWREQTNHVQDSYHDLPKDLGNGKTGSVLLDRALARVFKRGMYYQARHYLLSGHPERAWRRRVSDVLQDAARVRLAHGNAAATGDLADHARAGRWALGDTAQDAWARRAASRLEEIAVPVLTGRRPLTPDKVTAIRLTALCLARELDAARIPAAGDPFRAVLVGITLMERDTAPNL